VQRWLGMLVVLGAVGLLIAGCGGSSSGSAQAPTVSLTRAADVSTAAAGYKVAVTLRETVPNVGVVNATGTGSFSPAAHQGAITMRIALPSSATSGALQLQVVLDKGAIDMKFPPQLASRISGGKPGCT
jgi:hypothetical protein